MFKKSQLKSRNEYLFLFGVGGVYLYALNRAIIAATFIQISVIGLYIMGLFCLLLFTAVMFNRTTRIAVNVLLILVVLFAVWRREALEPLFNHFYDMYLVTTGYLPYRPELGRTMLWLICLALAFTTVVFVLHKFNFYVLALGGGTIFALSWLSSFIRDTMSFLLFLFAFILILVRKLNRSTTTVALTAPLCALVIILAQGNMPRESEAYERRTIREAFTGRIEAVEDFFYELFNPMYFSFASTGFGGGGGRLGGPVSPDNRSVMEVSAPGMVYLAGATRNHFTGASWEGTLEAGDIYTHGLLPGHFEMLENAAALIRGAGLARGVSALNAGALRGQFPGNEAYYLNISAFSVIGVHAEEVFGESPDVRLWQDEMAHLRDWINNQLVELHLDYPDETPDNILERLNEALEAHVEALGIDIYSAPEDSRFAEWAAAWATANPQYGTLPEPDAQGYVRYYWHAYLPMETVSVAMGRNRTGSVFRPPASRQMWFDQLSPNYSDVLIPSPMGDLRAPGFMGRDTIYHHHFLHVNPRLTFVADILHEAGRGVYAAREEDFAAYIEYLLEFLLAEGDDATLAELHENRSVVTPQAMDELIAGFNRHGTGTTPVNMFLSSRRDLLAVLDAFSVDVLAAYAASVREHFMYVPDTVPQRVHDLTAHIIRDEVTDFGRVTAIRDFLLANFPYTLTPAPVPRGACFVDHFLFEGREGYCTYYATAMAVMARIAGVPSRFLEGFVVPGIGRHDYAVTTVTNRMAHAWAEVYLEGFGWLTMEATPPQAFSPDGSVPLPQLGTHTGPINGGGQWYERMDMDPDDWLYYMQHGYFPWDAPGWTGPRPDNVPGTGQMAIEEEPAPLGWVDVLLFALVSLGVVIGAAALLLLAARIRFSLALSRVARLGRNDGAQAYFKGILSVSMYYHLSMEPGETTIAYGKRAGKRFAFKSDAVFLGDLIALYNRARYGRNQISGAELELMRDCYFAMLGMLRAMRLKPHYIWLRYVRGVGCCVPAAHVWHAPKGLAQRVV